MSSDLGPNRRTTSRARAVLSSREVDPVLAVYIECLRAGRADPERLRAALGRDAADIEDGLAELVELGLLEERRDPGEALAPADPSVAELKFVRSLAQARRREHELSKSVERIRAFAQVYQVHAGRAATGEFMVIDDPRDVQSWIEMTARKCTSEVRTLHPGASRPAEAMRRAREQDTELAARGVAVRVLYQHAIRPSLAVQAYARDLAAAGGEVRTVPEVADRLIVFDRTAALVPHDPGGTCPAGATVVTEPTVVAFLCRHHEHLWESAVPFRAPGEPDGRELSQAALRTLAHLLAQGLEEKAIARRLGMSPRTFTRHIARFQAELDCKNRFQAGVEAARRGLV